MKEMFCERNSNKKNLKKFRKARTFMCLYENKERKKEMKDKLKKILDEAMAQIDSSDPS